MTAGVGMDHNSFRHSSSQMWSAKYLMALGLAWGLLLAAFRTGCSSTPRLALASSSYVSSCLGWTLPCMDDDDLGDCIHSQSRAVLIDMV